MRSRLTNPIFLGTITSLIIVGAVYFAYNATRGVPLVPAYRVSVDVPNAANLVRGNDVRVGGARVGAIETIKAVRSKSGESVARLNLKLDAGIGELPSDSTVLIRPRSALGLKYVEITPGKAKRTFANGSRIPVSAARPAPVELDELLNMFDEKTQLAARAGVRAYGDGLAGRGSSINQAVGGLKTLLPGLSTLFQTLSDPDTHLLRFFNELGKAAALVAPVGEEQGQLFANLNRTFGALAADPKALQDSIAEAPAALDASTKNLPRIRPFIRNTEGLMHDLRPGARAVRASAKDLADAVEDGTSTLRHAVALNNRMKPLVTTLQRFSEDPMVPMGIQRLGEAARSLDPTLRYLAPAQTACNYVTLFFRNIASLLSEGDSKGTWQRFIIIAAPQGPNDEAGPSTQPANGPDASNHLHANPYPYTAAPGQPLECEAGNETYAVGRTVTSHAPGSKPGKTEGTP